MAAQHLDGLAVQGVHQAYRAVAIGQIDGVIGDENAVGEQKGAVAPAAQEVTIPVKTTIGGSLRWKA